MIGIYGGLFDPVHFGHLRLALELYQDLELSEVRFVPCHQPPHRDMPHASAEHRLAMLRLATEDERGFTIDECELQRSGPSYMVDTLALIREQAGDTSLCLILGMDAFAGLASWHRWQELIKLAHIVVVQRPGSRVSCEGELARLLAERRVDVKQRLDDQPAGLILPWPVTQLDISSTHIRTLRAQDKSVRYLVSDAVWNYIEANKLYLRGNVA